MKEGLENGVKKYASDKAIRKAMDKAQKEVSCMFFDHKWPILLPSLLTQLPRYLLYFDHFCHLISPTTKILYVF